MALSSVDDKFLGEKIDYYCSSSENESENEQIDSDEAKPKSTKTVRSAQKFVANNEINSSARRKSSVQTGPKGVIRDWRHYKKLESEEREKTALERKQLINKLSLTCDPKKDSNEDLDENDQEFLQLYNKKRMLELQQKFASRWVGITFGKLKELTGKNYVEEIENEKRFVTIIIHIYDESIPACEAMTGCLHILAAEYRTVKFCQIEASEARLSHGFKEKGLPALLAYKNNLIIGNFVHVSDTLSDDFYATDVEKFLNSYGLLPEKDGSNMSEPNPEIRSDSDSDY
ncbi:phosducin-like protein [Clavelina lepadiformis]|uniref:phosducin-like protein n=1 Tax=Clavelina lepadiformis TaxID=159417 RepID=UPI004041DC09